MRSWHVELEWNYARGGYALHTAAPSIQVRAQTNGAGRHMVDQG